MKILRVDFEENEMFIRKVNMDIYIRIYCYELL